MTPDIAIVVPTCVRPVESYFGVTLDNLLRAGVFTSPRFQGLYVADSRPGDYAIHEVEKRHLPRTFVYTPTHPRGMNENESVALKLGASQNVTWVLSIEDDIDVCAHFLDAVGAWLDDHQTTKVPIYSFGASYDAIARFYAEGKTVAGYLPEQFYCAQALAFSPAIAEALSAWVLTDTGRGTHYDILMADWAQRNGYSMLYASVPSFVQHIGFESGQRPGHSCPQFTSWPGREWTYQPITTPLLPAEVIS